MLSVCRPNEELRPIVNTDINKDMAIEMACLRHKNNLLQRNVDVLRDKNFLLDDTSEFDTEKY